MPKKVENMTGNRLSALNSLFMDLLESRDLGEYVIPDNSCVHVEEAVNSRDVIISYVTYQRRRLVRLARVSDDKSFLAEIDVFMRIRPQGAIANFAGFYLQQHILYHSDMPNGTLQQLFDKVAAGTPPTWWDATAKAKAFYGIAAAMMHVHAQEVWHRCLTPLCFMFDQNHEVRLCHFPCPFWPDSAHRGMLPNEPRWRAPETYNRDGSEKDVDDEDMPKTDVFSFGMMMVQLISGRDPFPGERNGDAIRAKLARGDTPNLDKDGQKLAVGITEACLKVNPDERPTFYHIIYALEHTTEALFPGVDMERFADYRQRIFSRTMQCIQAVELWSAPADEAENSDRLDHLRQDAERGDPHALVALGRRYYKGQGVERDLEAAVRYYTQAVESGSAEAMCHLGLCKIRGTGCPRDVRAGADYLARAAEKGNTSAMIEFSTLLQEGRGVPRDEARAFRMMKDAADRNVPDAQTFVARMYQEGRGTPRDPDEAKEYYRKAHLNGESAATIDLAQIFLLGIDGPQDINEGLATLKQAGARKVPEALFDLGRIYGGVDLPPVLRGKVPVNEAEALRYFMESARAGYAQAAYEAGRILRRRGRHDEALEFLKQGAEQFVDDTPPPVWHRNARYLYGKMCVRGEGGLPNYTTGVNYLTQAAMAGQKFAILELAELKANPPEGFWPETLDKRQILGMLQRVIAGPAGETRDSAQRLYDIINATDA